MNLSDKFYEKNYSIFSDTRFCVWDCVREFYENFSKSSYILDAGCGNGKNMDYLYKNEFNIVGIDNCLGLVNICKKKGFNVQNADIKNIPFDSNTFDFIMCIAVIHHLEKESDRILAINEMFRVLKKGGKLILTVWAFEYDSFSKKKNFKLGNNIVKFKNFDRYYYIYDESLFKNFINKLAKQYNFNVLKIFWERGKWVTIIEKN